MDKDQKINCNVDSCAYNDNEKQECELAEITVEPALEEDSGTAQDESMCGDYEPAEEETDEEVIEEPEELIEQTETEDKE